MAKTRLKTLFLVLFAALALAACGEEATPTQDYAGALTNIAARSKPSPVYQVPPNFSPDAFQTPGNNPASKAAPLPTLLNRPAQTPSLLSPAPSPSPPPDFVPPTPVLVPTPTSPAEGVLGVEDLGITAWTDTEISWSPTGDQFLLHVLKGEELADFYFLVRPPASPTASFKLSRTTSSSFAWSPDGRYLSFIFYDGEGNPGPVQLIDSRAPAVRAKEIFKGPCTSAAWINNLKLVAACGQVLFEMGVEGAQPELRYKLENNRFPGSPMELSLIARAQPSPDGNTLALYGLSRQKNAIPLGEIAFLNLKTGKLSLLNRENRPVAIVDWTPDSKYLILRNLTEDWAVPYTFDFYLADPVKLRISQNLTRTNDKCDPILGPKAECQGLNPSPFQAQRILFGPEGGQFLFTGIRFVIQPNISIETVERVVLGRVAGGKLEKPLEVPTGDKIVGATWLPNNHYFFSRLPQVGPAVAVLDGQTVNLKSSGLAAVIKSGTPQPKNNSRTPGQFSPDFRREGI